MTPLLLAAAFASPSGLSGEFTEAAADYRRGLELRDDSAKARPHFVRAAEAYERLWQSGVHTSDVARNMAQTRLLAGDVGRAIANYHRGLRVAPFDSALRHDLNLAREQINYPITGDIAQATRRKERVSPFEHVGVPIQGLAAAVLAIWAIGWLTLVRAWLTGRGGLAFCGSGCVVIALLLGCGILWDYEEAQARWSTPAGVVVSPAHLRSGNSDEYPHRFDGKLPAGVELNILGDRGGWLHVELADGSAGWVPSDRVVIVN